MKLTDSIIRSEKPTDKRKQLADGNGLVLYIMPNGSKLWRYRYRYNGSPKMLSLGEYPTATLKDARAERERVSDLLAQGIDPSIERKEKKLSQAYAIENDFRSVARAWWDNWKVANSEAHALKVWSIFEKDIFPVFGKYPVENIKPSLVRLAVKRVVERGAYDTAGRVHQYTSAVLSYAFNHELVASNVARDIAVNDLIPRRKKQSMGRVDLKDLPQLLQDIQAYDGNAITKIAIQLLSLTFVRTKELIQATWDEIDFIGKVWRIAPERMKMGTAHIVPLSAQTLDLLGELKKITGGSKHLFPSVKGDGKTMSNNTILFALYRMGYKDRMTGHGFRGVASTALREQGFSRDVVELQLSHLVGNEVERAYNTMELLAERTAMMQAWADYLDAQRGIGQVVQFKQA
jgi:integrase